MSDPRHPDDLQAMMYKHILKIADRSERIEDKLALVDKKLDCQAQELVQHRHRLDALERNDTKIAERCGVRGVHEKDIEILKSEVDTLKECVERDAEAETHAEELRQRKADRRVALVAALTSTGIGGLLTLGLKIFGVIP